MGCPGDYVLKPEWIKTVERTSVRPWLATFAGARWKEVAIALLDVLGLEKLVFASFFRGFLGANYSLNSSRSFMRFRFRLYSTRSATR
jgi:hypothetical protein